MKIINLTVISVCQPDLDKECQKCGGNFLSINKIYIWEEKTKTTTGWFCEHCLKHGVQLMQYNLKQTEKEIT